MQREIFRNLAVMASYVGNRGAWWQADTLTQLNLLTPQILAAHGLSLNNAADLTLLTSTLSSSTAVSRGFGTPPYPGFPLTSTVAQALRPFPQYGSIDNLFAPLGVSVQTVYLWVERKQIPHLRVMGRNIRFLKSDLEPFRATFKQEVGIGKTE